MSLMYKKGLTVEGKEIPESIDTISGYERYMGGCGYPFVPKDDVDSVTSQDLIYHPEKFRPFAYMRSMDYKITYEDFAMSRIWYDAENDRLYSNGHLVDYRRCPNGSYPFLFDLLYIRVYYPVLYIKLCEAQVGLLDNYFNEVEDRLKAFMLFIN